MYCNYIILVVVILIPLCLEFYCFSNKENKEASNDFSNEENEEVQKKIMFSPKKRGERLFLYFIYLFPLIISAIRPGESGFNIFDSIKSNMSFYATALTITFAVYSFLKTQNARENKDFELREKELEAKKDFFRPSFIIRKIEKNNKSTNEILLIMREPNLYLENIRLYKNSNAFVTKDDTKTFKSGEIIGLCDSYEFYITAETQIGEKILFAYNSLTRDKIYKYLKSDKHPMFPIYLDDQKYTSKNWINYNKFDESYGLLDDLHVFYSTLTIRMYLDNFYYVFFKKSLNSTNLENFFNNVFNEIYDTYKYMCKTSESKTFLEEYEAKIYELVTIYFNYLNNIKQNISIYYNSILYLELENKIIDELKQYENLINYTCNNFNQFNIQTFIEKMEKSLSSTKYSNIENFENILSLITKVFSHVVIDNIKNDKEFLIKYKSQLYLMKYYY